VAEPGAFHVVVAHLDYALEVERRAPDLVTTAWWKRDRIAAVFVDWNQNTRDHTIRSAYSVRGVPEAVVSTPLRWEEVPDVEPGDFTLATVPERFVRLGDVHAGIDDVAFSLEPLLEWADRDAH
jgi:DNA primase